MTIPRLRNLQSLVLVSTLLLAACGQKGPLFIPADETETTTNTAEISTLQKKDDKKKTTTAE